MLNYVAIPWQLRGDEGKYLKNQGFIRRKRAYHQKELVELIKNIK